MKFWDSSALVPLMLIEPRSHDIEQLLDRDDHIATADIASLEVTSAIWRRKHRRELTVEEIRLAETVFARLTRKWIRIEQSSDVVQRALVLLSRHPLRTLDAIQLASALVLAGSNRNLPIVTLDARLATAARAEGFPTLP